MKNKIYLASGVALLGLTLGLGGCVTKEEMYREYGGETPGMERAEEAKERECVRLRHENQVLKKKLGIKKHTKVKKHKKVKKAAHHVKPAHKMTQHETTPKTTPETVTTPEKGMTSETK